MDDIKTLGSSIRDGNKDAIMVRVDCRIRLIGSDSRLRVRLTDKRHSLPQQVETFSRYFSFWRPAHC
jgi:hypothetical protein